MGNLYWNCSKFRQPYIMICSKVFFAKSCSMVGHDRCTKLALFKFTKKFLFWSKQAIWTQFDLCCTRLYLMIGSKDLFLKHCSRMGYNSLTKLTSVNFLKKSSFGSKGNLDLNWLKIMQPCISSSTLMIFFRYCCMMGYNN